MCIRDRGYSGSGTVPPTHEDNCMQLDVAMGYSGSGTVPPTHEDNCMQLDVAMGYSGSGTVPPTHEDNCMQLSHLADLVCSKQKFSGGPPLPFLGQTLVGHPVHFHMAYPLHSRTIFISQVCRNDQLGEAGSAVLRSVQIIKLSTENY